MAGALKSDGCSLTTSETKPTLNSNAAQGATPCRSNSFLHLPTSEGTTSLTRPGHKYFGSLGMAWDVRNGHRTCFGL